jgi:hypothetical protein
MRRRIERSRARCEKAATKQKPVKGQEAEKLSKLAITSSLESDEKGG